MCYHLVVIQIGDAWLLSQAASVCIEQCQHCMAGGGNTQESTWAPVKLTQTTKLEFGVPNGLIGTIGFVWRLGLAWDSKIGAQC